MAEQALLMLEVPSERDYLFQSPALRDVRGAAALLESLNRFTLPTLASRRGFSGAGIVVGGRRYVATFPDLETSRRFAAEAQRTYRGRTIALGLRVAQQQADTEALLDRFGLLLQQVRLGLEQDGALTQSLTTAAAPELRWCTACRLFPASQLQGEEAICRACAARRTHIADQESRLQLPGYRLSLADAGDEDLAARPVWERYLRWARDAGVQRGTDAAADMAALMERRAAASSALADANGWHAVLIGQINDYERALEYLNDSQRALRTVIRVNHLLDETLFEAVTALCWRDQQQPIPFELLLVGGDRFVAIVPAEAGPAVAARCLRGFEGQSAAAMEGRRLSIAAGVGLAPASLSLAIPASLAERALGAARADYLRTGEAPARGSWRSVVGLGTIDAEAAVVLNAGEMERALAHARALRRNGLRREQVQAIAAAGKRGQPGPLAAATADLSESQRRAIAAVWRDLEGAEAAGNLFGVIGALLAVAGPDAAPGLRRPGPTGATLETGRVS